MLGRTWGKWDSDSFLVGVLTGEATMEGSVGVLTKLNIEPPYDSAVSFLGIYLKDCTPYSHTWTSMLMAALFTTARKRNQPRCPPANKWIVKIWYICTIEFYSAIKKFFLWKLQFFYENCYWTRHRRPRKTNVKSPLPRGEPYLWTLGLLYLACGAFRGPKINRAHGGRKEERKRPLGEGTEHRW